MEKMKTMIAGILLTSTLFTACRKDTNMMVDPATPTSASARTADAAFPIHFYDGYVIASRASVMSGERQVYSSTMVDRIELFAPVVNRYQMDPADYRNLVAAIDIRPFREHAALTLIGKMMMADGTGTEVRFMINAPATIKAHNESYQITDETTFMRLLNIKPELLTRDIAPAMMANLERREGVVVISSDTNVEVWRHMVENLRSMTGFSFAPAPQPAPDPQPAPTAAVDPGPMR